jgi:tRNA A37 threonylcarbamoyltransferase TsaD
MYLSARLKVSCIAILFISVNFNSLDISSFAGIFTNIFNKAKKAEDKEDCQNLEAENICLEE